MQAFCGLESLYDRAASECEQPVHSTSPFQQTLLYMNALHAPHPVPFFFLLLLFAHTHTNVHDLQTFI